MNYRGHELSYNKFIKKPKGGSPIEESRIFGVDTESFHSIEIDRLHTSMVLVSSDHDDRCYEPTLGESPFHHMVDNVFYRFSEAEVGELRPANTAMQKDEEGKWKRGRAKIPYILLVFYNLEYDIQRLFNADSPFFNMARVNIEGTRVEVDGYEIENVHMVLSGSAPHFTIILRKDGRVLKVYALDLWGYLKNGLGVSAVALGIVDKLPIDKSYFHIPLEELSREQIEELRIYALRDSNITRMVYITLVRLLVDFAPEVLTKKGILPPSAPAASARIAFSKLKGDMLKQSPEFAVEMALEAYNGGLVFARVRGEVKDIIVGDRNSAYPTMMTLLPDPERVKYILRYHVPIDELIGKVGFCRASFEVTEDYIPFITTYGDERSNHAPGRYARQAISIYELTAGYLVGAIQNITVHETIYLSYDEDAIGTGVLADFVHYFHRLKNESEKGSALYMLAKLLMNSLYGKLIEMRDPENLIIPSHVRYLRVPWSWKFAINNDDEFLKQLNHVLLNQGEGMDDLIRDYPPKETDSLIFIDELLENKALKSGTFFLPFYASLITAGQRAWMSVYTYYTKAYLADTDSAFSPLSREDFENAIREADKITTRIGVGHCQIGTRLGDIDVELEHGSGYISGIKQYSLRNDGGTKSKIAHHAIVAPSEIDEEHPREFINLFYHYTIGQLSRGKSVTYSTKASPIRIRTALLRGRDFGRFETGIRTITPKQDPRQEVIESTNNSQSIANSDNLIYYKWVRR